MASTLTSKDFSDLIKIGVTIIKATPTIAQAVFRTQINALGWANADWNLVETLLGSIGYTQAAPTFVQARDFWLTTTNAQERLTRQQLQLEFEVNPLGRLAALKAQKDAVQLARDLVRDTIQNVLQPWLLAPGGAPLEVIDAVNERTQELRNQRDVLNKTLDGINASIAGLGG